MNRRFYILTLASVFCCLLLYTLYPAVHLSNVYNTQHSPKNSYWKTFEKKNAFATMICDPKMMEPTMVSIYSLNAAYANKPSSKSDIIVLLPESIEFRYQDIESLEKLGARIVRTSFPQQLDTQDTDVCNDVVNLWALFDYQKIVYFTPEILFDNDVDLLFNYPAGAALTNDLNTSLFVLEPNPSSFELLIRDYRQISESKHITFTQLIKQIYLKYPLCIPADSIKKSAQIFTGPMKPWMFHSYGDVDWKKQYDPIGFYKWRRTANDMGHLLSPVESDWKNQARQHTICDSYIGSKSDINAFPIQDQFSVMISTYNPERIEYLSLIIQHLLKSSKVHTVFVTWHNPALQVPASLYRSIQEKDYSRLKVLSQTFDSLNNRFNPVDQLQTDAVYILDDDVYVDIDDLEFTFSVWQSRKDSVVGHFPRLHTYNSTTHEATYDLIGKAPYSIVLTKSMFIRSDYLFAFTCLLEPKLHEKIDRQLNCEDLGFSMMASGMSGVAPTYVRPIQAMKDFGLKKGISTNTAHMPARSQCISDFITDYWNEKDPLILAYDAVAPFIKPVIDVGDWDQLEKIILH